VIMNLCASIFYGRIATHRVDTKWFLGCVLVSRGFALDFDACPALNNNFWGR
jgi:hypothetical protein